MKTKKHLLCKFLKCKNLHHKNLKIFIHNILFPNMFFDIPYDIIRKMELNLHKGLLIGYLMLHLNPHLTDLGI